MLEVHSPLGPLAHFECDGIMLTEDAGFTLTQVAGDEKITRKHLGKLPATVGKVLEVSETTILRVAEKQFWVLGKEPAAAAGIYLTPLSSGRTRIVLQRQKARQVLAASALIDFDSTAFKPGQFVLTGIHHTPVTIHCIAEDVFHIYALRTFAVNVWEWLCDVAKGLDHA